MIGFIRLRIPSDPHRTEISRKTGIIRELHVYGWMIPVGQGYSKGWQHKGWGETLIKEAEYIASNVYDMKKMIVMSALGTKEYYAKLGYQPDGVYMAKYLTK